MRCCASLPNDLNLWRMGKAMLLAGLLLALSGRAIAQVKASASFDPVRVEAGDTFSLRVLVSGARVAPKRVSFAAWNKQLPADNVLNRSEWTRSGAQWVQRFTLVSFDSAALQLPPLTVQLHLNDTVQTNPLALTVVAPRATAEIGDMDDIRDIRREPTFWHDYWPEMLTGLSVLLLIAWLIRRRQRRTKPLPVATPLAPPPPSAYETALEKLENLHREKPWQKGRLLEYYAELSLVLRGFLEGHYGFPALESTTREIAAALKKTTLSEGARRGFEALLEQADWVKYAEIKPPESKHEEALKKAIDLIRFHQPGTTNQ